ncbi:hypothetical protein BDV96DRAFT_604476 [Lophiotrema nucula]|uniref:Uncharacterized protein n=1 Tax=Lophiotrema nucula TaxID=690887 RepID=A0A6A5YSF4_9PLEO|nr:hypothetical protein BDV96DRAFT_604476 [Lophiotrema nucula]
MTPNRMRPPGSISDIASTVALTASNAQVSESRSTRVGRGTLHCDASNLMMAMSRQPCKGRVQFRARLVWVLVADFDSSMILVFYVNLLQSSCLANDLSALFASSCDGSPVLIQSHYVTPSSLVKVDDLKPLERKVLRLIAHSGMRVISLSSDDIRDILGRTVVGVDSGICRRGHLNQERSRGQTSEDKHLQKEVSNGA